VDARRAFARALGVDILQKIVEIWLTGEAFLRSRDIGIQDQPARDRSASLVALAPYF
jgi:hypothetical protein